MEFDLPEFVFVSSTNETRPSTVELILPALSAVLGGAVVFLSNYFFERRTATRRENLSDYRTYLFINVLHQDVFSVASRQFELLGDGPWPVEPWSRMKPIVDFHTRDREISVELLEPLRDNDSELSQELLELTNYRNSIMNAVAKFSEMHINLTEQASRHASELSGDKLLIEIDKRKPEHRPLVFMAAQVDDLAKQILEMSIHFYDKTIDFASKYNSFKARSRRPSIRKRTLDIDGFRNAKAQAVGASTKAMIDTDNN